MRVTNSMMSMSLQGNSAASLEKMQQYQMQLGSGKRINRASDDPTGTNRVMTLRSARTDADQHSKNVSAAKDYLNRVDSSLGSITKSLQEVKRLGLSAATDTALPEQRAQVAEQVQSHIDSILREVNGKHLDRQLFSGHETGTVPVTANADGTFAYAGDEGVTRIAVGDNAEVTLDLNAKKILNMDGAADSSLPDVLSVLTGLKEALTSGTNTEIQDRLKQVEGSFQNVLSMRGAAGVKSQQMDLYAERLEDTKLNLEEWIDQEEGVDLAEAYTRLQTEQNVYQASLLATSKMTQTSLVDYLR